MGFYGKALIVMLGLGVLSGEAMAGRTTATFGASLRIAGSNAASSRDTRRLRYTCGAAAHVLLRAGFLYPRATSCRGRVYYFNATRDGERVLVRVNSATGILSAR